MDSSRGNGLPMYIGIDITRQASPGISTLAAISLSLIETYIASKMDSTAATQTNTRTKPVNFFRLVSCSVEISFMAGCDIVS